MEEPPHDGLLDRAWDVLVKHADFDTAQAFFERYVEDGKALAAALTRRRRHAVHADASPVASEDTTGSRRPRFSSVSTRTDVPAGKRNPPANGGSTSVGRADAPQIVPVTLPPTQVNQARHVEILERRWLVTGFVLTIRAPGHALRRVPLNYRRIRLGTANSLQDVGIDLPDGVNYQARLELHDEMFVWYHESGDVPTLLGDEEIAESPLRDGDLIRVGTVEMQIFKLLEPPAELNVASGPVAGERYLIDVSEVRLGRPGRRVNDIVLSSVSVSREHATIRLRDRRFWLHPDTRSSPTVVNGVRILEPRALSDHDQIVLGEQSLLFRVRGENTHSQALEAREATVLFSDLRGWTTVAETTPMQELITQINDYYKAMGEVIHRYGGTLMTYQGDAIMAVFGAPSTHVDDPWRAIAAALEMLEEMKRLNEKWQSEGKSEVRGGIGIHTGQVMVGELGHQSRLEYSVMGDATNLAARLEQLTKDYGCPLIISGATRREVGDLIDDRPLGMVTVRGRSAPTEIFHVVGLRNI